MASSCLNWLESIEEWSKKRDKTSHQKSNKSATDDRSADVSRWTWRHTFTKSDRRCEGLSTDVNEYWPSQTVQKESRGVLGTSFRFGPTSKILEKIQYGGSSVVKTDSQRSRFIAREEWFTVLSTQFAFIMSFEVFLVLYSKQSFYKCLINLSCPAGRYYRKK